MPPTLYSILSYLPTRLKYLLIITALSIAFLSTFDAIFLLLALPLISINSAPSFIEPILGLIPLPLGSLNNEFTGAIVFACLVIIVTIAHVFVSWLTYKISAVVSTELTHLIYKSTLQQPYSFHLKTNSSQLLNSATVQAVHVSTALSYILQIFSSIVVFIACLTALLLVNPSVTLAILFFIGLFYFTLILLNRRTISNISATVNTGLKRQFSTLKESFSSIREILVYGHQYRFISRHVSIVKEVRSAQASSLFISLLPKTILEGCALVGLSIVILYFIYLGKSPSDAFALCFPFAVAGQRMLPSVQSIYNNFIGIKSYRHDSLDILTLIQSSPSLSSSRSLSSSFQGESDPLLKEICLEHLSPPFFKLESTVAKPSEAIYIDLQSSNSIGITGSSGSGKSSLVNTLLGLIPPSKGRFLLNGKDVFDPNSYIILKKWQSQLSIVSQSISLPDMTILQSCLNKLIIRKFLLPESMT